MKTISDKKNLQTGALVQAVFRPDTVGIVERVYGDNGEIIDVRRPGLPSFVGAPANAFAPVADCSVLYGVGLMDDGGIKTCRIVSDVDGLQVWMNHTPSSEIAASYICRLGHNLDRKSAWRCVAELLAEESARALGLLS